VKYKEKIKTEKSAGDPAFFLYGADITTNEAKKKPGNKSRSYFFI